METNSPGIVGVLITLLLAEEMTLPQMVELKLDVDSITPVSCSSPSPWPMENNSLLRSFYSSFSFKGFLSMSIT